MFVSMVPVRAVDWIRVQAALAMVNAVATNALEEVGKRSALAASKLLFMDRVDKSM